MRQRWLCLALLLLTARVASADISVDPASPIQIDDPIDGATSSTRTITISATPALSNVTLATTGDCLNISVTGGQTGLTFDTPGTDVEIVFQATKHAVQNCTFTAQTTSGMTTTSHGSFVVAANGTGGQLQITTTSPLDFGQVRHKDNALSATQNVAVRNAGESPLTITGLSFVPGGDGADFPTAHAATFTIAPNVTENVAFTFNPGASGMRSATLQITSNDPVSTNATQTIVLTGMGTNGLLTTPGDLNFGTVPMSTTSSAMNATLRNTAAAPVGPVAVTGATITGTGATWFRFGSAFGCAGGTQSCTYSSLSLTTTNQTVPITCTPPDGATGTETATATFASDSDLTGIDNTVLLTCTSGRAQITVTPLALVFGNRVINANHDLMIAVMNTGVAPLTYSIVEQNDSTNSYSIVGTPAPVDPMMSATFIIRYRPTAVGASTATFRVNHNDPSKGPQDIMVSGTGTVPTLMPPAAVAFGAIDVGKTSGPQTLTVTNSGSAPLTISNAALGTTNAASYAVAVGTTGPQTTMLAPGASTSWTLTCSPAAQGAVNGTFVITSDTGNVPNTATPVTLNCTGNRGLLVINAPTTHDFAGVAVGETRDHTFVLRNDGNVTVNNITVAAAGVGTGYTIQSPTFPITLANGASQNVVVRFAPADAADGNQRTFTFSGTWGTAPVATTMAVATVDGNGLAIGYDTDKTLLAFGNLRFDDTPTQVFCIANNGDANLDLLSISIGHTAPTAASEVQIVDIRRAPCNTTGGSALPVPYTNISLDPNEQPLVVTVRMAPANRLGALAATITINSTLTMNPTRTVQITGNSISAAIATTPGAVVDFGPTDLDAGAQTRDVVITNTGMAPLDLTSFARTADPAFTLTLPPDTELAPTQAVTITVTYTPTIERPAGQNDSFVLSHAIAGVHMGPAMQMITVQGRGVDRHISVAAAPQFPPTFRNPGSAAPVRAVTVTNTGGAPLAITSVMVTNADVWQLVDPNPVTIPAESSHDFMVRFVPMTAGAAPQGVLVLANDDNDQPMAEVRLDGAGLDRMVALLGDPVELGYAGIGTELILPDGLVVASMDTSNAFTIREIQLDGGDGVFSLPDAPENQEIAASAQATFDIVFAPTSEGEFEATAKLFLDEDPTQAAEVRLHGTAVFVDIGGGGGCSSSRGAGTGMLVVVAALLIARRRRVVAAGVLALAPLAAQAQGTESNLDLTLFAPTFSTTGQTMQVQTPGVGRDGAWVAGAVVTNASNPMVISFLGMEHATISRRTMFEVGGAYAFLDRFEAGLRLPLYNQDGDGNAIGVSSPSGTARGDLLAHVRAQLLKTRGPTELIAGASLAVTFPTASDSQYAGVDKPTGRVLGLVSVSPSGFRRLTLTANAGAVIRAKTTVSNIEQGSGVAFGGAATVRVLNALWAFGEIYGDVLPGARAPASMQTAGTLTTSEWLAGLTFRPDHRINVGVGAGRGLISGLGTPDLRVVLSVTVTPGADELPPLHPPPPPFVDRDTDGDGIMDSADQCKDEREDMDGFQDGDGCPDTDNDGDGFLDSDDQCPLEAEDKDGFSDDDGCPDLDNDNDGIPDLADKCPLQPEDKDGFEDADGCPDADNDRDGIPDAMDKCPAQPETINGITDDDGCPDEGDSAIALTPSTMELLESVDFTGSKLKPNATKVLGQVAATLRAHPEILRVKVNVHTNPAGNDAAEKSLTEQRAMAIREWLIKAGIAPERVQGAGMGGTKPLLKGKKSPVNERVEIIILERK